MIEQQRQSIIRVRDMADRPGVVVGGSETLSEGTPLFQGAFWNKELRRGLFVHGSNVTESERFTVESRQQPGLACIFFVEGDVEVSIGDRDIRFQGDGTLREALIISSAQVESFRRRSFGRRQVRHLVVSVTPEWLGRDGLETAQNPASATSLVANHLATHSWRVTPRIAALVNRLTRFDHTQSQIGALQAESAAIAILAEALDAATGGSAQPTAATLSAHESARLARAIEFVLACGAEWPSVETIAREAGVSASGLQRLFHAGFGVSVFDYIRTVKLDQARKILLEGECTIQQAASIAGYSSAANFATAFKRQFGVTPSQLAP